MPRPLLSTKQSMPILSTPPPPPVYQFVFEYVWVCLCIYRHRTSRYDVYIQRYTAGNHLPFRLGVLIVSTLFHVTFFLLLSWVFMISLLLFFFFSYFWLPLPSSHQEHARMYSRYNILDSLLNLSSFLLLRGPFTSLLLFMYIFHLFFFNGTKHFWFIRRCHRDRVYRHRDRRQDAGKRKLEKRERERERERERKHFKKWWMPGQVVFHPVVTLGGSKFYLFPSFRSFSNPKRSSSHIFCFIACCLPTHWTLRLYRPVESNPMCCEVSVCVCVEDWGWVSMFAPTF